MPDTFNITDFLEPVDIEKISDGVSYKEGQIGKNISAFEDQLPDLYECDVILLGCAEERGSGQPKKQGSVDRIRREFYSLYNWHIDVKLSDIGNVKSGATLADTYAALKTILKEINSISKTTIILGGSHDLTLAQYYASVEQKKIIEATCVDALVDLNIESSLRNENFLMEILTGEPNFIRHYNHIGFQSYFVHPLMLETMDKLRFDCFRVGNVKENMEEMEPVIRNSQLFSFDVAAIANAYAPSNFVSPNGFTGEEACMLMRYAGLSPNVNSVGIYGYSEKFDKDRLTAKQVSQMVWYFMDGRSKGKRESLPGDKDAFNEFHTVFAEVQTVFLQSKKTGRWWMQLPDHNFIACSQKDYLLASSNEIPERWLRAQERS